MKQLKTIPYYQIILPTLAVNFFLILLVLAFQKKLPPVVPLFYGRPAGEEQLFSRLFLTLPALISILIIALNLVLINWLRETFLQKILLGGALIVTALAIITTIKIAFLVGTIF